MSADRAKEKRKKKTGQSVVHDPSERKGKNATRLGSRATEKQGTKATHSKLIKVRKKMRA